jgi:hypothetical protein
MRTVVLAVALTFAIVPRAHAQQKSKATQLFEEGRKLMRSQSYAAACPMFEESFTLDPAVGTTLNLALCYEKLGRLATAYQWYEKAATLATASKQDTRANFAHEQMTRLDTEAAHIVVQVAQPVPALVVTRNGVPVITGTSERIDAGSYDIAASAQDYQPWQTTVSAVDGQTLTIDVPALLSKPAIPKPAIPRPAPPPPIANNKRKTRMIIGYTVGGASVACLLTGLGFGLAAKSAWDDARDLCPAGSAKCLPTAVSLGNTAGARADVATVMTAVGMAGIGASVVILLTAPQKETPGQITFTPTAGQRSFGLTAEGRF